MAQHKWAREIHAWADGAEIETRVKSKDDCSEWADEHKPSWFENEYVEYRIKQKYIYVYEDEHNDIYQTSKQYSEKDDGLRYIGKIKLESEASSLED